MLRRVLRRLLAVALPALMLASLLSTFSQVPASASPVCVTAQSTTTTTTTPGTTTTTQPASSTFYESSATPCDVATAQEVSQLGTVLLVGLCLILFGLGCSLGLRMW